jgi:hypothetical protein
MTCRPFMCDRSATCNDHDCPGLAESEASGDDPYWAAWFCVTLVFAAILVAVLVIVKNN